MKDSALNRISTRTFKKEPLSNEDIDKISSIVFDRVEIIDEMAAVIGRQSVVVVIDIKKNLFGQMV